MKTIVTASPEEAAAYVRAGDVAAFPTETVYGLGADALNPTAVRKIFDAKSRPADNPLIIHLASHDQIHPLVGSVTDSAHVLIGRFFPGPLTVILEKSEAVPSVVTAGLKTVALRMPAHPIASAFLNACDRPVAAPSANRSGRPSPTTWQAVRDDLDGRIACILTGGRARVGLESTVVDCTGRHPVILRAGAISREELRGVLPEIGLAGRELDEARSPGMRHRHYAPAARVVIVDQPPGGEHPADAYIGLDTATADFRISRVAPTSEAYAHELFDFFRECDDASVGTIYCQQVDEVGIGLALMDRLRRASEGTSR